MPRSFHRQTPKLVIVAVAWLVNTAVVVADPDKGHSWSYIGENGPDHWCHQYDQCCGIKQSPVNIDTNAAKWDHFPSIQFHHYDREPSSLLLRNNGHSVYVDLNQTGPLPMINDGSLGSNFILVNFHFHWPAEHTINGHQYPLEMHIVHYNSRYGDVKTALKNSDGIAVLGIMFEVGKKDNLALMDVTKNLPKIKYAVENVSLPTGGFSLMDLLPTSTLGFYRYYGSLTTPECQEIVTWTVFETVSHISERQLAAFRTLKASHKEETDVPMSGNFRPVQPLKGRRIRQRIVVSTARAHVPCLSLVILLATVITIASSGFYK